MKEAKSDQKNLLKQKKKITEQAAEISADRSTERETIEELFLSYYKIRLKAQETVIEREIKMKSIINEAEWDSIVKNIDKNTHKNKVEKSIKKTNEKIFTSLIKKCEINVADQSRRKKIVDAITAENNLILVFIEDFIRLNYKDIESIRAYSAGYGEYRKMVEIINKGRLEILHETLDLRALIIENSTEEEWQKISKEFAKLIKNNSVAV